MTEKKKFIESGNYRIGKLIKKDSPKYIVRCDFDDLLLSITESKVPLDNISVGDIVQVFRMTLDSCILIDYIKKEEAGN